MSWAEAQLGLSCDGSLLRDRGLGQRIAYGRRDYLSDGQHKRNGGKESG
jgi:hypothetical protein